MFIITTFLLHWATIALMGLWLMLPLILRIMTRRTQRFCSLPMLNLLRIRPRTLSILPQFRLQVFGHQLTPRPPIKIMRMECVGEKLRVHCR